MEPASATTGLRGTVLGLWRRPYLRVAALGAMVLVGRAAFAVDSPAPHPTRTSDPAPATSEVAVPLPAPLLGGLADAAEVPGGTPVFEDATASAGIDVEHHATRIPDLEVPRSQLAGLLGTDDLTPATVEAWAERTFTPRLTEVLTLDHYGTGQAWGDIDGDGDPDLYLTDQDGPGTLLENLGDGTFERSPLADEVARSDASSLGATFVDADGDGWLDLHVVGPGPDALFRNLEGRGFEDVTGDAGIDDPGEGQSATWGDFDSDGDLDVYVTDYGCQPCNDAPPVPVDRRDQDHLYRNDGEMRFTDLTSSIDRIAGTRGLGFAAQWLDVDDDGDLDLYVVNDVRDDRPDAEVELGVAKGDGSTPGNVLLRNDGPGCAGWCFTDVSATSGAGRRANAMGLAAGDADGDGDVDLYFTNTGFIAGPAELLLNDGSGRFRVAPHGSGADLGEWAWGTTFIDVDNDGALDLYAAVGLSDGLLQVPTAELPDGAAEDAAAVRAAAQDGSLPTIGPAGTPAWPVAASSAPRTDNDRLLLRRGDGYQEQVLGSTGVLAGNTYGVSVADADGDGWPDVVTGDIDGRYRLLRNRGVVGAGNHRLSVRLRGTAPGSDPFGVGSRLRVHLDDGRTLTRWVLAGGGQDLTTTIGLGASTGATIEVRWPDGTNSSTRVPADVRVTLDPTGIVDGPAPLPSP